MACKSAQTRSGSCNYRNKEPFRKGKYGVFMSSSPYPQTTGATWRALALLVAMQLQPALAQDFPPDTAEVADVAVQPPVNAVSGMAQTLLANALDCRVAEAQLPGLLTSLRELQPGDFTQVGRQYSDPDMDLYQLAKPVHAWGNEGDAIVITANRVMLAVRATVDEAGQRVDDYLEQSDNSPVTGLLDAQHGLVVYSPPLPGLQDMALVGCEYHIDDLSLLDDPADAWRKQSPPNTQIGMYTGPRP
jgi:hypothetical protein